MSYKVNENITVSILIEDVELVLEAGNALHTLHIVSGSQLTLPVLCVSFSDTLRVVPKMNLTDGSKITVTISGTKTEIRYFRVHRWSRSPVGDGFSYNVEAYWDAPKYWAGTAIASMRGSSKVVIEQIASMSSIEVWSKNTETADTMLWMPCNKSYGLFCREIARHGYATEKSHMVLGVDSSGKLRYVDVNANENPKFSVGYTSSNDVGTFLIISDFQPSNSSGLNNQIAGYRHERYVQNAAGASVSLESALQLDSDSKYPMVNSKVRDIQERGTVSFSPINFGNVHEKYERARYQNARYNLLNSVKGEFLFAFQTGIEMADNFFYVSPSELENKDYDGEFTATTKVIFIAGSDYQEKVVAVKNGLE